MSAKRQNAHQLVAKFRDHKPHHKAWYHVERGTLADGMDERIDSPNTVNQGHYGTCGTSAIVRDIIDDEPEEYVKLTTHLFWTGRCKIHHGKHAWGMPLVAGYDLRRFKPHPSVHPADWMLTATLRDNLEFCRLKLFSGDAVKGTSFEKQKELLHDIGYRAVTVDGAFGRPAPALTMWDANSYLKRHFHVQIGIDATLIKAGQQDAPAQGLHNHWVELLTPFTVTNEFSPNAAVTCKVFSWGHRQGYTLPIDPSKPLKLSVFSKKFFGYVAAKY